jgi:hypothetical protein
VSHFKYFFVLLLLVFFTSRCVYAQSNSSPFEISIKSNVLQRSEEFSVEIHSNYGGVKDNTRFKVRPIVTGCNLFVYNHNLNGFGGWVSAANIWSSMPNLDKDVKVRLVNCNALKSEMLFFVLDSFHGQIYETNKVYVYTDKDFISSYIHRLNSIILGLNN